MPLVKPFCAFRYNPKTIKRFSEAVCPPYDVIDEKQRQAFKKKSCYNFCNILTTDNKHDYKYLKAKFLSWIEKGVLIQDDKPCFYLYEQKFKFESKLRSRVGFLGLLRIDKKGVIFPHEHTFSAPKRDRYSILKELEANLSPIFVIASGKVPVLSSSYAQYKRKRPLISFIDSLSITNKVWRIDNAAMIRRIEKSFLRKPFFIADGHHRFEVSYRYFKEMKNEFKQTNYILAYFTDTESGILVLPTHRVVNSRLSLKDAFKQLLPYFDITKLSKKSFHNSFYGKDKDGRVSIGLYADKNYYFLKLKSKGILDKIFSREEGPYKKLDVYILHKLLLSRCAKKDITYTHSLEETVKLTKKGLFSFILKPTSLETVFNMAKKGYRLPQKTTYFYPKLLSGIVVRRLEF